MKHLAFITRRMVAATAALLVIGGVLAFGAAPAPAAGPIPVECDTGGTISFETDETGTTTWSVRLDGLCSGSLSGLNLASVRGTGTSTGAGLCSGSLVVQDLDLDVVVSEQNVVTGRTVTTDQTWHFPVTLFPAATPFAIGGDATGVGTASSRIFLQCGASGSPTARAIFSFVS